MSQPNNYFDTSAARSLLGDITPDDNLNIRLSELRRIRLVVGSISGLLWGALAFLGTLLAWIWIDLVMDLPPELRLTAWCTAFGVLIFFVLKISFRANANAASEKIAQALDVAGNTGGEVRSGLDLTADNRAGLSPNSSQLSSQLADMAVQRAAVLVYDVPTEAVAPIAPAFKSAAALAFSLFVLLIVVLIGPRMAWTEIKRFFNPYGDNPAYSQYTFEITTNTTQVLYGEDLEIEAAVYGPEVDQLQLVLIPAANDRTQNAEEATPIDVLPMFPDPSGSWHASIANVTEPFDFFLRVRRARSETHAISVITVPEIRDVRVEITAPLYTGLSVYRGSVPAKGIAGLAGTEVRLTITSNRPLAGGSLTFFPETGDANKALLPDADPSQVSGSFLISENGRVDIQVTDEAGQPSTESHSIPIRLINDLPPMVRMIQPRATSFATPSAVLPIAVSGEDDYGLRRCQLYRSLNNSRFLPTDLEVSEGTPRRLQTGTTLRLAEYDLQPGDEIRLFARVEDNDPNGPAAPIGKGSESSVISVRIISQEDFDRVQQQKAGMKTMMNRYQQAQRRLESLADEMQKLTEQLAKAPQDSELAKELRDKMQKLAEQMQQEADAIQKLGEKPLPLELDKELAPQLKEMADKLREISKQMAKTAQQPNTTNKAALEQMQKQLEAMKNEQQRHQEEAMKPLEQLAQVLPLKQAESEFTQLVQKQRQLADRLQSLKDQNAESDPAMRARMRELEEEQHRIREQLDDLLDRIEENANNLPDEPELEQLRETALNLVKAVRECQAGSVMADAEGSLTEFDGTNGHAHAEKAAKLLEQFLSKCSGMGEAAGQCLPKFNPGLGQCMTQTLEQLSPGSGMKKGGKGLGSGGSGGYSSQMSTMNNVGMYGGTPQFDPANSSMGESQSDNIGGVFTDPYADGSNEDGAGFTAKQTNPAFGGSDWGVPIQYRRQAGKYLQRLAEDLEE